jgi:hypothetical protein
MKLHLVITATLAALAPAASRADEASWIFAPAQYSHSPTTGERVAQYCPEAPAFTWADDTYMESAYRHSTMNIQVGDTSDHLHIVQTWGQGLAIRPYGEWEYPFRAGATPYGPWGNPQGPWTLPFDSWRNPYGLGQLPNSSGPYPQPYGSNRQQAGPPMQQQAGPPMQQLPAGQPRP